MALLLRPQQLQRLASHSNPKKDRRINSYQKRKEHRVQTVRCGSAIAIDAPSSSTASVVRWGHSKVQGPRSEMEDEIVLRTDGGGLAGFSFAAVFDGHSGFSTVEFIRDALYDECERVLEGGLVLTSKNFKAIKDAIQEAFVIVDAKLITWLEQKGKEDNSGSTATAIFVGDGVLIISHIGDCSVVISRSGRAEVLTGPHRPYGNNMVSLGEIKRIREAGGWIVDGRICGEISVSRAFGDVRFKTKKNEMLEQGVEQGRWTKKFISRIKFKGDLLSASPDIYLVDLGSDIEFILLASDGLWDYIKSSEAVNFVRNELRKHGDVQLACEALTREALDRCSQDNVSVVIADLGRTDWQNLPVQGPNFFYEVSQALGIIGIVSLGIYISSILSL
ncbi:putative protein phosphatase 2C 5 [Acorus calamus]|uniref:protein-serine/threonine phosphatase n=1 Tax=Acorus calamus TaxID=4465 RepID=A0AAV9DLZ9_ACOCL|nr:putative protein phosphatase 2C 5 [Acorus calamus]